MTSQAVHNSEKDTHNKTIVIEINEKLEHLPPDDPNSHGVSICPVPKSFSSTKPEAFLPQFLGHGPYHHSNAKLIMTENLKLGVAKRILKINHCLTDNGDQNFDVSAIQALYHTTDESSTYDSHTLSYILTIDGLFLLALLHSGAGRERRYSSYYILTGKHYGLALLNYDGIELTMDGIIKDVFMLENQIPTCVLFKTSQVFIDDSEDLHRVMIDFCEVFCPLLRPRNYFPQVRGDHLLDLMYKLVAPACDPEPEPARERYSFQHLWILGYVILYLSLWMIVWSLVYYVVLIVLLLRSVLVKVIPWFGTIFGEPKMMILNPFLFLSCVTDLFLDDIFTIKSVFTFPLRIFKSHVIGVEALAYFFQYMDSTQFLGEAETIPSATELYNARIRFKAVEGDISSLKFDGMKGEIYLPRIKLDATSKVILRNLVAYESLIDVDHLNLARYIELMRALIRTTQDVQLLVYEKIIQTELSADFVAQIFYMPLGKLTGKPAEEFQMLERLLMKVMPRFEAIQYLIYLFFVEFLRACVFGAIFVVFSPLLGQAFQKILCITIFGDNSSESCKGHQVGDYGRNNYYISSM